MTLVLNGSVGVSDVDGSAATPAIRGTDANTGMFFPAADTTALSQGGVERVRVNSSGNVGIGSSSPDYLLTLQTGDAAISFKDTGGTTRAYMGINGIVGGAPTGSLRLRSDQGGILFVQSGTETARIDTSGNLLVGTASVINGSNAIIQALNVNGGRPGINVGNSSGSSATNCIIFTNSNGTVGSIQTSGTSTSYVTSSDYRLKNSVSPMTTGLATVAALKPVTYKWNADNSDGEGFIAHELQAVIPYAVTGEKDAVDADEKPIHQGVDYSKIVVHLVAAIQELKAENDALKARVEALENV